MIAKRKKHSNLIQILCVLLGTVFAFTTGIAYGAFSWSKAYNSGYATGMFLPNQSYQIINDSLPNGINYGSSANQQEIALQYSYDYDFDFCFEYSMSWSNGKDCSNVILNYANRDAWFVDDQTMYYKDSISAGSGTLPIIVGVNFTETDNEDYYGAKLTINITNVKITKAGTTPTSEPSNNAYLLWKEYRARKQSSYTGTDAYVTVYDQTSVGDYKPTAPGAETAYRSGVVAQASYTQQLTDNGYEELMYLESTGTQYITTNVPLDESIKISLKFSTDVTSKTTSTSAKNGVTIFGATDGNMAIKAGFSTTVDDENMYLWYGSVSAGSQSFSTSSTRAVGSIKTLEYSNGYWMVDNTKIGSKTTLTGSTSQKKLYLFAENGTSGAVPFDIGNLKIYSFKVYQGNDPNPVAEYVPVKRLTDGVLGFYEVVSNNFYSNSGTGTFEYGPLQTSHKQIFGNKNYVGIGAHVVTGASTIKMKATVVGAWNTASDTKPSDVHIATNTIKYNFAENWGNVKYSTTTEVYETRTFDYYIPAHSAVYIDIIDTVEMITRGYYSNADYSGFYIVTQLEINGTTFTFSDGMATGTITTTSVDVTTTELPTRELSVFNMSIYEPALYSCDDNASKTVTTQVKLINNTASTLNIASISYNLMFYISNGNSSAGYSESAGFADTNYWVRVDETLTVTNTSKSVQIAPYSSVLVYTSYEIPTSANTTLSAYNTCDKWASLIPNIGTVSKVTTQSGGLAVDVQTSGTTANVYVTNLSNKTVTGFSLSSFSYEYNDFTGNSQFVGNGGDQPDNWAKNYWRYYVKLSNNSYVQNTVATWNKNAIYYVPKGWVTTTGSLTLKTVTEIAPNERVLVATGSVESAKTYNFSGLTASITSSKTAESVNLVNESTGKAYLINNSTSVSYYVRFKATASETYFYKDSSDGYTYFMGLIRPGQVIPLTTTATSSQVSVEVSAEASTGSLPSSLWSTTFINKMKSLYA